LVLKRGGSRRTEKSHIGLNSLTFKKNIASVMISKRMRCGDYLNPGPMEKTRNAHKIVVRKTEGKRSFRKSTSRLEDSVRTAFKEIWRECAAWIHLVQNRPSCRLLRKR
jgi:hypothetical protein